MEAKLYNFPKRGEGQYYIHGVGYFDLPCGLLRCFVKDRWVVYGHNGRKIYFSDFDFGDVSQSLRAAVNQLCRLRTDMVGRRRFVRRRARKHDPAIGVVGVWWDEKRAVYMMHNPLEGRATAYYTLEVAIAMRERAVKMYMEHHSFALDELAKRFGIKLVK